jgi:hypothetical protein
LRSKWAADKARGGRIARSIRNRSGSRRTVAGPFSTQSPGRGQLAIFPRCSLLTYQSRILEKQNWLQMSQVFMFAYVGDQMVLAFQGFYKRDRRRAKVIGLPDRLNMHAQSKTKALPAAREKLPRFLPLTNFGPAVARPLHPTDAAPQPTMVALHLAGLRRPR